VPSSEQSTPIMNLPLLSRNEIIAALGGVGANHNLWRAVLSLQQHLKDAAVAHSMTPGLSDADRHYFAGYACQAHDTMAEYQAMWEEGQKSKDQDEQPDQPTP
jgi:hypothetical protein